MLAKRIVACLDIRDGRVVKGINFGGIRDAGDPVEAACHYSRTGADELVFLDITASSQGRKTMLEVVRAAARQVFVPITVGGGISALEDIHELLNAGADKISLNTAAVKNPRLIEEASRKYGRQCIVAAVDARRNPQGDFEVCIYGGSSATGLDALKWCREVEHLGAGEILLTSIDRDGTKQGFDVELTSLVAANAGIPVVASGGAGTMQDFADVFTEGKADAALAASLFHFGEIGITELKQYLAGAGIPVRHTEGGKGANVY